MMGLFGENPTWGYFSHNLHHALQSCMKFLSHTLVSIGVFKKSNIFCMRPEVAWELCAPQRFPIAGLVRTLETERVRRCVWGTSDSCQVPCSSPTLPAGWTPGGTRSPPPPRSPAPPGALEMPPGHKGQCIYPATRWIPPLIQLFVPFFPG